MPATRSLAAGLVSMLALAACSGGSDDAVVEQPPAQQLADARAVLEKSPAVMFTLESTGLPGKAVGVSGAKGTGLFEPPSFEGTLNASIAGVTGTVEVVAVEQDVYMKFFTPTYNKIDPATYGAPNPAQLFNTETGITSLITRTQSPAKASTVRDGSDVLNTFTGTLPGDAVADLLVVGDRKGTFDVTYGVTQTGKELRSVVIKGPFYAGATSTYTLRLTSLANPVVITRP
ncbi:MAG: LppX_LprAFG lipoprotein [Pedococcus sp.]